MSTNNAIVHKISRIIIHAYMKVSPHVKKYININMLICRKKTLAISNLSACYLHLSLFVILHIIAFKSHKD